MSVFGGRARCGRAARPAELAELLAALHLLSSLQRLAVRLGPRVRGLKDFKAAIYPNGVEEVSPIGAAQLHRLAEVSLGVRRVAVSIVQAAEPQLRLRCGAEFRGFSR